LSVISSLVTDIMFCCRCEAKLVAVHDLAWQANVSYSYSQRRGHSPVTGRQICSCICWASGKEWSLQIAIWWTSQWILLCCNL